MSRATLRRVAPLAALLLLHAAACASDTTQIVDQPNNKPACQGSSCPTDPARPKPEGNDRWLDTDNDGVIDLEDNCPNDPNPDQRDVDGDTIGDVCDNCPTTANADQRDSNGNGIGDACEEMTYDPTRDTDGDGVPDIRDNCPNISNPDQRDTDGDGVGDVCDNCPLVPNPGQTDSNGNGRGDACLYDPVRTECFDEVLTAEIDTVQPDIYFLLDSSGSMADQLDPNRPRPWPIDDAVAALRTIGQNLQGKARIGLGTYPERDPATTENCRMVHKLDIGNPSPSLFGDTAAAIRPYGNTPTGFAVRQVYDQGRINRSTDPSGIHRPRAIVLITDGEPSQRCLGGRNVNIRTEAYQEALEQISFVRQQGIPTYVVGFQFDSDISKLNALAESGGTDASNGTGGPRYYQATNPNSLVQAVADITRRTFSCAFRISGYPARPDQVSVKIGNQTLSEGSNGYSLDLATGVLTLNGSACESLRNNPNLMSVRIDITMQCVTQPMQPISDDPAMCVPSGPERCDYRDNDCDGIIDEGCDECTPEICDGIDNDCDGEVDEGCAACVVNGNTCSMDADCCFGDCYEGSCERVCRPGGIACTEHTDCCSGTCSATGNSPGICIEG